MIRTSDLGCSHQDAVPNDVGEVVCLDCGLTVDAREAESSGETSAEDRAFSLLSAAARDRTLSLSERAAASATLIGLAGEVRDVPEVVTDTLTPKGREEVRRLLPDPNPEHFPHAVHILLARLRAAGHTCAAVACESVSIDGRAGYRVSWEGDGWERFSRRSPAPDAGINRAALQAAAESMGLVVEAEAAPSLLLLVPGGGPIVVRREALRRILREKTPIERALATIDQDFASLDAERDAALAKNGRTAADVTRSMERAAAHRRSAGLPDQLTYEQLVADIDETRS